MQKIRAIIGLGNPGSKYAETRHNIGYMLIELLRKKLRSSWKAGKGKYHYASCNVKGDKVLLVRSTTYMNESGRALVNLINTENIKASEILVIYDDFALPFGTLRFREGGSDGGHNGMNSAIYELGTEKIPRLRLGIGPIPPHEDTVSFVLEDFTSKEKEELNTILNKAVQGVIEALHVGLKKAQSNYNRKIEKQENKENNNKESSPEKTLLHSEGM